MEGPSYSVASGLVEARLVGVDSLCGYVALQVEVEIDEEAPSVAVVLAVQRGKAYQVLHSVVEA